MAIGEVSHADRLLGHGLKIINLDILWLVPGPDFSSIKCIRWVDDSGFLAEASHHRIEAIGTAIKIRETRWPGSELVVWIRDDVRWDSLVRWANEDGRAVRDIS